MCSHPFRFILGAAAAPNLIHLWTLIKTLSPYCAKDFGGTLQSKHRCRLATFLIPPALTLFNHRASRNSCCGHYWSRHAIVEIHSISSTLYIIHDRLFSISTNL
ncbi:hypothetical protein BT96DRAFT_711348 [Gymnopus androsaceus JB14]|uniref:Secreted protein n=1 Tax=Gymnopus androsaceus JB14 TaxID=1447944 RepID=A0A6A4GEA1_9AGAR|nr:hypothetical protein BT96DRAFT_711348 [Gymnopus androsaceus JB14]